MEPCLSFRETTSEDSRECTMLEMPRRSVTRFFIPLIDVLTLLFCVFLVMPLATNPTEDPADMSGKTPEQQVDYLREEVKRLRRENTKAEEDLKKEQQRKLEDADKRLFLRVFEIDAITGQLFTSDPDRRPIDEAAAQELVERDQQIGHQRKLKVVYLILYPRDRKSSYPLTRQRENYQNWFAKVALRFDIPGRTGTGG
jgi:hypothetical protein